ncbi:hypothetical protein ACT29H_14225 [Thermophagus sp. OGC60D27]|uniref:hypothetical protein n=1 Tax=Thermophagus sp. OGC60D27 TaxID=3458415 RepID=UPI0040384259
MKTKLHLTIVLISLMMTSGLIARPYFDKEKDLLVACFDLKPDEDDVHAGTALACMLLHPDLAGINYYAVAGTYGEQEGKYVQTATPDFFNQLFGPENKKWTDAHANWNKSIKRVRQLVKSTLKSGGKIFIQEAGQSDFTHDLLKALINSGVAPAVVKNKIIVVQHSKWNEDQTNQENLQWVKNNTHYVKIDDGNKDGNNTPGYKTDDTDFLIRAKKQTNPNAKARAFWTQAEQICKAWDASWINKTIDAGGLDFSDCVENWWIFDLDDKADNVAKFWDRYVTNEL